MKSIDDINMCGSIDTEHSNSDVHELMMENEFLDYHDCGIDLLERAGLILTILTTERCLELIMDMNNGLKCRALIL